MADRDSNSPPEEVYPNSRWVPCASNLVCHESSGSPERDGIENLQRFFHPSRRRKYRSYRSAASIRDLIEGFVFGSEMSPYPPPPLPKSKKRIKEELIEERMGRLAQKIRKYEAERKSMPHATKNPRNTLFVARLRYESTTETLVNEFRFFGEILDAKLVTNKVGRSRGYAFIEFTNHCSIKNALTALEKKLIDGREVLLDYERGRLETGWLPRRLGGGLGVKPKRPKKKSRREWRKKKKEKAKAHKAGAFESSSNRSADFSDALAVLQLASDNLPENPPVQRASSFVPQIEEIPVAGCVQCQRLNQYSLPSPDQISHRIFIPGQLQQSDYSLSYSNFNYPSQMIPAHQFDPRSSQNFEAQSQSYRVQQPNHLTLQPANRNISYSAPNWQPNSQTLSLPPQNYQAPPVFYPVQQSVVQNSYQFYQNYSGGPENHHSQQSSYLIFYAVYEDYIVSVNVSVTGNEAIQIDLLYPTEQVYPYNW